MLEITKFVSKNSSKFQKCGVWSGAGTRKGQKVKKLTHSPGPDPGVSDSTASMEQEGEVAGLLVTGEPLCQFTPRVGPAVLGLL